MGQQPRDDKSTPSLELPSLPGFGRRKKVRRSRREDTATLTREPVPREEPDEESTRASGEPIPTAHDEPTRTIGTAATDTAVTAHTTTPADETASEAAALDEPTQAPTAESPADAQAADGLAYAGPRRRAGKRSQGQQPEKAKPGRTREPRTTPLLPGPVAAVLTGLVVGGAGAAGTYGAMTGCKAVRGVSSCGGGPGFFILVAIVVLMVLLGAGILRLLKVSDPGSTSFLGVGLVAVISMLVLLDVIFSPVMFVVIPALSALAFALAHWVTTRFADDKGRRDWT